MAETRHFTRLPGRMRHRLGGRTLTHCHNGAHFQAPQAPIV